MFLKTKSPPEELAEQYAAEEKEDMVFESVEMFLSRRCLDRAELIHELSRELAQLQLNYDEVVARLKKHEPDYVEREVHPYNENDRMVKLL